MELEFEGTIIKNALKIHYIDKNTSLEIEQPK